MVDDSRVWLEWEEEWTKRNPELANAMVPIDPNRPAPSFKDMATHYDSDGTPCGCNGVTWTNPSGHVVCDKLFNAPMSTTDTMVVTEREKE